MFRRHRRDYPQYFLSAKVEVRPSEVHGVGVFAKAKIEAHELIEGAPVILFHTDTKDVLREAYSSDHVLMDYPFTWSSSQLAFSLGYGGIYNHSTYNPNATWQVNEKLTTLDFYSRHVIEPDTEIVTRYISLRRCEDGDLWFEDPAVEPKLGNLYSEPEAISKANFFDFITKGPTKK